MAQPLSSKLDWQTANPQWAAAINPVINNPLLQGHLISGIVLPSNTAVTISHELNRMMIGWWVVDTTATSSVWRTQSLNTKTLTIESSATTTVALWVF